MLERLAQVEVVLGEQALVRTGHRNGRHVMERLGPEVVGEVDRVVRAGHVEQRVARLVGGDVVDRREVEEVLDPAAEARPRGLVDAQQRLGQVARHQDDPLARRGAEPVEQRIEPRLRARAHQHVHVALALQQALDQVPADEPGGPGDEGGHAAERRWSRCSPRKQTTPGGEHRGLCGSRGGISQAAA